MTVTSPNAIASSPSTMISASGCAARSRAQRGGGLAVAARLRRDDRVLAELDERRRRQLPAGIAIDARRVDEQRSAGVAGETAGGIGHSAPPMTVLRWTASQ